MTDVGDKVWVPEVLILGLQLDLQYLHGGQRLFRALQSPMEKAGTPQTPPLGEWRAPVKHWHATTQFVSCFHFFFPLGTGTFCTEIRTKQNHASVKWKSSRLFPRCTVLFVQAADLGEGAQNIMPVPLGKHIQTMVCV